MKDIIIIGAGEIGNSLKQVEEEAGNKVYMRDLEPSTWERNAIDYYDVCHVAIPYKDQKSFVEAVRKHMLTFGACVTIIHSTVEVGTTRKLINESGNPLIVHSFVRGIHPNLAKGIQTFVKIIAGIDDGAVLEATTHYESIGVVYTVFKEPEESEMAKLLSTTYYGWNILFAKMVNELCESHGLDYDSVYTYANETYNNGYELLDMDHVKRPVLSPPDGRIGGHCIVPNFHLLPDCNLKKFCIEEEQNVRC